MCSFGVYLGTFPKRGVTLIRGQFLGGIATPEALIRAGVNYWGRLRNLSKILYFEILDVKHMSNCLSWSAVLRAEEKVSQYRLLFSTYLLLKSSPSQEVAVIRACVKGAGEIKAVL